LDNSLIEAKIYLFIHSFLHSFIHSFIIQTSTIKRRASVGDGRSIFSILPYDDAN